MKRLIRGVKNRIVTLIMHSFNGLTPKQKNVLTFIPHGGSDIDGNSFQNYKSDSALTFFHHILSKYGSKYKYQICCGKEEIELFEHETKKCYPNCNISFYYLPKVKCKFWYSYSFFNAIRKSKHVFTSELIPLRWKVSSQKFYYLGYYSCSFKNDLVPIHYDRKGINNKTYDYIFSTSLLFAYINSPVFNIPLDKFVNIGMARNDNLYMPSDLTILNDFLDSKVTYNIERVYLYTPTHRDYEQNQKETRNLLGLEIDKDRLEKFLRKNQAVIICKLHSHQNNEVISKDLPEGIILYEANPDYGLCELLQRADYLITDYTSTYFDFLLLDKPVLFNFYDFDKYRETRGFAFDPIGSILAGEIFTDEESFFDKMALVIRDDLFKSKRQFVRNLVFKHQDSYSNERIYRYIFND